MNKMPSEAIVNAWIALMKAQQSAVTIVERAFRDAGMPSPSWYDALWELERAGEAGLRPFQLEEQMLTSQSNISRLVDKLESKGLVERRTCEGDGRGQVVVITEAGQKTRRRVWPAYAAAIMVAIGNHITDDEAKQVTKLLSRLA